MTQQNKNTSDESADVRSINDLAIETGRVPVLQNLDVGEKKWNAVFFFLF